MIKKISIFFALIALVVLSACSNESKLTEVPTAPVDGADVLGYLTVNVDLTSGLSNAVFTSSLDSQALLDVTPSYASSDFSFVKVENFDLGGTAQINSTYTFPNKLGDDKEIVLVAIDAQGPTAITGTPFFNVESYDGVPITDAGATKGLALSLAKDATGATDAQNGFIASVTDFPDSANIGGGTSTGEGFQALNAANGTTIGHTVSDNTATVLFSSSFTGGFSGTSPAKYSLRFAVSAQDPQPRSLVAGDIAIIGANATNPDEVSFVALVDLAEGTEIIFTDNGVKTDGTFRANEGESTFVVPAGGIAAGTVTAIDTGTMSLSTSGDQVIAYVVNTDGSPLFLYALNFGGASFTDAIDPNTTALPTGLVVGETAVAVGKVRNSAYAATAITSGTKAALLAAIADSANWTTGSSQQTILTAPFTIQ